MNYLSWADLTAYLDWSGLRPMSELEFERAGRGPYRAVSGEYAWGSTSITQATSISNAGLPSERAESGANANVEVQIEGPLRVGSFASGGVATRIDAGAGYYGAMELSGNLYERPVTVGDSTGRSFEGRYHGNGALERFAPVMSRVPTRAPARLAGGEPRRTLGAHRYKYFDACDVAGLDKPARPPAFQARMWHERRNGHRGRCPSNNVAGNSGGGAPAPPRRPQIFYGTSGSTFALNH